MKKILIFETFPISPHFETAIEIALKNIKEGNKVYFFWGGYNLPWSDWKLPNYKKLLFFSYKYKVDKAIEYLKENSVIIVDKIDFDKKISNYIERLIKKITFKNLKNIKYKNFSMGLAAYSSLLSKYHSNNSKVFKNNFKSAFRSGCIVYERANKVINQVKPNIIYTFNSRFVISRPILEVARRKKIKVYRHERGSSLDKYEIFKNDIFDEKYFYNLINKNWKKEKNEKKKKKIVLNHLKYIETNKYYKKLGYDYDSFHQNILNLDHEKKNILFICTTDYEHQAISHDYKRFYINKKWSKQINAVKSLIDLIKKKKNFFLIIKAHPNFRHDKKLEEKFNSLQAENVIYLPASSKINTYDLIKKSNIICSFGSSLELLSSFYKKKTISFFKTLWLKFNIVDYPKNNLDLKKKIFSENKLINNKKKIKNVFKIIYYMNTFGKKYKYFLPLGHSRGLFKKTKINHYGPIFNNIFNLEKLLKIRFYR